MSHDTVGGSMGSGGAGAKHTDADLINRVRSAIDHWEETGVGPTSSLTGGGAIAHLEDRLSQLLDGLPTLAVASGTAALRVALESVGVVQDSHVVCPGYDWPAGVAAIRSIGAQPIFADVEPGSLTIDPARIRPCLTPNTRAVIATHLFGIPADVAALRETLDPLGIPVVEDCAQGLGATIGGLPVGTLGQVAAFSFGPGKIIDAGEGGLVAFEGVDLYRRGLVISQHPLRQLLLGMKPARLESFNSRMHPVAAILALSELRFLDERLAKARRHAKAIRRFIRERDGVTAIGADLHRRPSWWRVPIRCQLDDPSSFGLTLEQPGARVLSGSSQGSTEQKSAAEVLVASTPFEVVS